MAISTSEQVDQQIDAVTSFVRSHLLWILGLLPVVVASLRLLIVSEGDRQILSELVQGLDIPGLVIASVLPVASTMLLFVMFAWQLSNSNRWRKEKREAKVNGTKPQRDGNGFWRLTGWIVTIALLISATPLWLVVVDLGVFGVLLIGAALFYVGFRRKEGDRRLRDAFWAVVGLLMILATVAGGFWSMLLFPTVFSSSVWLPRETVAIRNASGVDVVSGYVLSADNRWIRLMTEDKSVIVVGVDSVVQRVPQKPHGDAWHRTVIEN